MDEKTSAGWKWPLCVVAILFAAILAFLYYTFAATENGGGYWSDAMRDEPAPELFPEK